MSGVEGDFSVSVSSAETRGLSPGTSPEARAIVGSADAMADLTRWGKPGIGGGDLPKGEPLLLA